MAKEILKYVMFCIFYMKGGSSRSSKTVSLIYVFFVATLFNAYSTLVES